MRTYYIFLIRDEIYKLVKDKPDNLYKILESIYLFNNKDAVYAFKMFNKICKRIPKKNYDKLIKDNLIDNTSYTNYNKVHLINDFLENETTKLIINNSHIKLKTNVIYPVFFKYFNNINNLFVCDFVNSDYFFLRKVKEVNR